MIKERILTSTSIYDIDDLPHCFSTIEMSFYADWSVKIYFFHEIYNAKTRTVLGNETVPLFVLFVFAICQRCNTFLTDDEIEYSDDFVSEDDILCYSCWTKEIDEDERSWYLGELLE